jgi:hypothetical protein
LLGAGGVVRNVQNEVDLAIEFFMVSRCRTHSKDVLIVCGDGLKGLPDAIRVAWADATVQTCVLHLVRNSLRYVSKKRWRAIEFVKRDWPHRAQG